MGVPFNELTHGDEAGVSIHDEVMAMSQEAVFSVCQVPADLFHPRGIRAQRDPGNVHAACLQVHHRENVERHQSILCPDSDSREVRGKDRIPVGLQKR